jgi:hypothetical protein
VSDQAAPVDPRVCGPALARPNAGRGSAPWSWERFHLCPQRQVKASELALPMTFPSVPRVEDIGKSIIPDARDRADDGAARQLTEPGMPRRRQPHRDRAVRSDVQAIRGIDGVKPAPHILDRRAEARQRVGLKIDVAELDKAGASRTDKSIALPVDAGVTNGIFGVVPDGELRTHFVPYLDPCNLDPCAMRRYSATAASAWIAVVSNSGTALSSRFTSSMISVHPRMMACAPRSIRRLIVAR